MSSLATAKTQVVILVVLVFLLGEFTILAELFHQVALFWLTLRQSPLGLLLILPFSRRLGVRIGVGIARVLTLMLVIFWAAQADLLDLASVTRAARVSTVSLPRHSSNVG
jgi:hypothetical protein